MKFDDSPSVLWAEPESAQATLAREALLRAGFDLRTVTDASLISACLEDKAPAVLVADVAFPQMDSLALLRLVRKWDLDVGVVAIYDAHSQGLAEIALEHGAISAIERPFTVDRLVDTVNFAVSLLEVFRARRHLFATDFADATNLGDRAALERVFEHALGEMTIVFQPIISWTQRRVIGHEALLRCRDPYFPDPLTVFAVAERLGRVEEIGRLVRAQVAEQLMRAPAGLYFVNLHPQELLDESLYSPGAPLSQYGKKVVLGISESMLPAGYKQLEQRTALLRALGFRFAIKNVNAGHTGMGSWVRIRPEYVVLDGRLVRRLPREPQGIDDLARMVPQLKSMGIQVVAAGIETLAERDAAVKASVDLLQGFAFSKPDRNYRGSDLP